MIKTFTFIRNSIFLFIFLLSNYVIGQNNHLKEIEKLLLDAEKYHQQYKDIKELEAAKRANILAKKINNSAKIAESSYIISRALSCLELQKESFFYIQKTLDQKYTKNNDLLQAKLKEIKAYNFYVLSLKSQSNRELKDIEKILKNKSDSSSIRVLARAYGNIANHYFDENKNDSAFFYYKLEGLELHKLPEKNSYNSLSDYYIAVGNAFSQKKIMDSAFIYYQKSYNLKLKYKNPILFTQYMIFGNYYSDTKEYSKALEFYLKSFQNMKEHSINSIPFNFINKKVSDIYGILGDKNKQKEYGSIYLENENKINIDKKNNVDYALSTIIKDEESRLKKLEIRKYLWILGGILVLLIIFIFIYNILRKNLKYKEKLITQVHSTLQEKDNIISQKSMETQELQLKINDAYNEVIALAKNNDPSFYFRFQEVYPDFQKKLIDYSPGLRTTELVLCAYTFLGFNIKDVAEYTFKSINTVRNRKQNLRKKFNIPTEQDMGIWLRNLTVTKSDD
ncbi:helix-turn-helix transcriptional regulator [Chryseobacterium sp. MMS23-Vi53]|uniref:helix-turn-helix transcriptional regulator n=1 Tax=Chryseobacterium sp. MMS23-Vi53 TaxID=3386644 RepID=UPI0039EAEB7A